MNKTEFNKEFDIFKLSNLANGIKKGNTPIRKSKLFEEGPIKTTTVKLVLAGHTIKLIDPSARGEDGELLVDDETMDFVPLSASHLKQYFPIKADDYQDVKGFGPNFNEAEEISKVVSRKQGRVKQNIDATIEYQMVGAMSGKIFKKDGVTVLCDLHTKFQIPKTTAKLDPNTLKLPASIRKAKRKIEKIVSSAGAGIINGWVCFCADDFFDSVADSDDAQKAFTNAKPSVLLEGFTDVVTYQGVEWKTYSIAVGGTKSIADGKALLVPVIDGLLRVDFAPADYEETINTDGLPYYSNKEELKMNRGFEVEMQSNPIVYCSMPNAIAELTLEQIVVPVE